MDWSGILGQVIHRCDVVTTAEPTDHVATISRHDVAADTLFTSHRRYRRLGHKVDAVGSAVINATDATTRYVPIVEVKKPSSEPLANFIATGLPL